MKSKTSSQLIVLAILVALAPIGALYSAWIFSSIWDLLVRPQYGAGPTYESWYGFSTLFSLAILSLLTKDTDKDEPATTPLIKLVVSCLLMLMILGIAHAVHAILGWP